MDDQKYRDLKAFLSAGRIPAGYSDRGCGISNAARSQYYTSSYENFSNMLKYNFSTLYLLRGVL